MQHLVLILSFIYLNHPVFAEPGVTDQDRPIRTELYFGWVPAVRWKQFLAREVTPLFPDGLTWFDVAGQWKAPDGEIEKEHSRLLIILYPDTRQNDQAVEKIRQQFKKRFHQQAVLRVSLKVEAKDLSALDPPMEFLESVAEVGRGYLNDGVRDEDHHGVREALLLPPGQDFRFRPEGQGPNVGSGQSRDWHTQQKFLIGSIKLLNFS